MCWKSKRAVIPWCKKCLCKSMLWWCFKTNKTAATTKTKPQPHTCPLTSLIESGANNNKLHLVALLMYTGTFFRLCFNVRMQYSSLLLHKEQI